MKNSQSKFDAGVAAYSNKLYNEAESIWLSLPEDDTNYAQALFNLAILYQQGHGQKGNEESLFSLYQQASQLGLAEAQYNFADMFYNGNNAPRDLTRAIYWWSQAANQGHPDAQYNLGFLLAKGDEVPQDLLKAQQWLTASANSGNQGAITLLEQVNQAVQQQGPQINANPQQLLTQHESWLFHQDPQDYTLELNKVNNIAEALSFIRQNNIEPLARFYVKDQKIVVVAGIFSTKNEATRAAANLTNDLKLLSPKARLLSTIQKELRSN